MTYRGRFAPTPSGPLHLGSLLIAVAGWLAAKKAGGEWLLRIDDLDAPRCPPGLDQIIQRQLEGHGLTWHGSPQYQSQQVAAYQAALETLQGNDNVYACHCTRAVLAATRREGPDGPVYNNQCRQLNLNDARSSLRFRVVEPVAALREQRLGQVQRSAEDIGDFVVRRADGQLGYQLACCVDEQRMGITEIVRGMDLLGSSIRQQQLMQALDYKRPAYLHLPLVLNAEGRKLSKQNHASGLAPAQASQNLQTALSLLGLSLPKDLSGAPPQRLLDWAAAQPDS